MTLDDIYCKLAASTLVGLAMADSGTTISTTGRPRVVNALNEGLANLYGLFELKDKEVLVQLQAGITFYHLRTKYSQQGYDPVVGVPAYILDLGREKFQEDILTYLSVYNDEGFEVPLNDLGRSDSVFTPQDKILQVPEPKAGQVLSIMYKAGHPAIECDVPGTTEIELPAALVPALLSYIGYKVYSTVATDGASARAMAHQAEYQTQIDMVQNRNLVNDSRSPTNERFHKNGWI